MRIRECAVAVGLIALLAACSQAAPYAASIPPSQVSPAARPSQVVQTTPTASPWGTRADAVIRDLGGQPTVSVVSTGPDPVTGEGETIVQEDDWELRWGADGALVSVVRLSSSFYASPGSTLSEPAARSRISAVLDAVASSAGQPDTLRFEADTWDANWTRTIGGLASDDGTMVMLASDGSFISYRRTERPTQARPARILTRAEAIRAYDAQRLRDAHAAKASLVPLPLEQAVLAWAAPGPDLVRPTLRLCWRLTYGGPAANPTWGSMAWLDAGTGALLDVSDVS